MTTIWMSNLGYLRGINGGLAHHFFLGHRHIYCPAATQKKAIRDLTALLTRENPDICCFVEIDQGSSDGGYFNQIESLVGNTYPIFDIENKYGPESRLRHLPRTKGKSNAFIAKRAYPYEKLYFAHGTKRLVYKIQLQENLTLFFAHFSLKKLVRAQQLLEVRALLATTPGEAIFLGDFNILSGFQELDALLKDSNLHLVNRDHAPTFRFHRMEKTLDLCICSQSLIPRLTLEVIHQPFSDHEALVVRVNG